MRGQRTKQSLYIFKLYPGNFGYRARGWGLGGAAFIVYFTNVFISSSFNIYISQNICVHVKNYTK